MTTLYMVNLIITICSNIIFHIGDSGTIDCRNQQCQEMELYCTANENCSIDCAYDDGDGEACQDAIFHCPTGYTCTLNCGGSESCDRVQIDASQSTALGVSCSDARESCKQMQIDCPSTSTLSSQPNCHIKGDNTNNANVFDSMRINHIYGLNGISFNGPKYLGSSPVYIACGSTYSHSCTLEAYSPYTDCTSQDSYCNYRDITSSPTVSPKIQSTISPTSTTMSPSAPTNPPTSYSPTTMNPTPNPSTNSPTTYSPTMRSRAPTTMNPTSKSPTIAPTMQPTTHPLTDSPTYQPTTISTYITTAPTTNSPTSSSPSLAPTTDTPTTTSPTTINPSITPIVTMNQPTTASPSTLPPSISLITDAPTTNHPTTNNPTTPNPTNTPALSTTSILTTDITSTTGIPENLTTSTLIIAKDPDADRETERNHSTMTSAVDIKIDNTDHVSDGDLRVEESQLSMGLFIDLSLIILLAMVIALCLCFLRLLYKKRKKQSIKTSVQEIMKMHDGPSELPAATGTRHGTRHRTQHQQVQTLSVLSMDNSVTNTEVRSHLGSMDYTKNRIYKISIGSQKPETKARGTLGNDDNHYDHRQQDSVNDKEFVESIQFEGDDDAASIIMEPALPSFTDQYTPSQDMNTPRIHIYPAQLPNLVVPEEKILDSVSDCDQYSVHEGNVIQIFTGYGLDQNEDIGRISESEEEAVLPGRHTTNNISHGEQLYFENPNRSY